ncbi:MAG: hypothetical protein ACSLE5_07550 [Porticoccaceae bacterium]
MDPVIGLLCFAVLFASWFRGMSPSKLSDPFASLGFSEPLPVIDHVFGDFEFLVVILFTETKLR